MYLMVLDVQNVVWYKLAKSLMPNACDTRLTRVSHAFDMHVTRTKIRVPTHVHVRPRV